MNDNVNKFIQKCLWVAIALLVLRCVIAMPQSAYDVFGYAGEAIGATIILMGCYNAFLWRFIPFEKVPRLMGNYSGSIEYNFDGQQGIKETVVTIKQTLLKVTVKVVTNEITSNTLASSLIEENGDYVLYYTYITHPKSKVSKDNPIQYGIAVTNENSPRQLRM